MSEADEKGGSTSNAPRWWFLRVVRRKYYYVTEYDVLSQSPRIDAERSSGLNPGASPHAAAGVSGACRCGMDHHHVLDLHILNNLLL